MSQVLDPFGGDEAPTGQPPAVADPFGGEESARPAQRAAAPDPFGDVEGPNPGTMETGTRLVGAGLAGLGSSLASGGEYLFGSGGLSSGLRGAMEGYQQRNVEQLGAGTQRARQAEWLPGGDGPSAWEHPMQSLAVQATEALPSILVSVIPGTLVARGMMAAGASVARAGLAAGAVTGPVEGALSLGSVWQQISSEVRNASPEELQQSVFYRDAIASGKSDREAREMLAHEAAGLKPLGAAAVSAFASAVLEGPMAAMIGGKTAKGVLRGMGEGAAREGGEEFIQSANEEASSQYVLKEGLGRPENPMQVLRQGVQGGVVGVALGGAMGSRGAQSHEARVAKSPVLVDMDPALVAASTITDPGGAPAPVTPNATPTSQAGALDPGVRAAGMAARPEGAVTGPLTATTPQVPGTDPATVAEAQRALAGQGVSTPATPAMNAVNNPNLPSAMGPQAVAEMQEPPGAMPTKPPTAEMQAAGQPVTAPGSLPFSEWGGPNDPRTQSSVAPTPAPVQNPPAAIPAAPLAPDPVAPVVATGEAPSSTDVSSLNSAAGAVPAATSLPAPKPEGPRQRLGSKERAAALAGSSSLSGTDARIKAITQLAGYERTNRNKNVKRMVAEAEKSGQPLPDWLQAAAEVVQQNTGKGGNAREKGARWQAWEDKFVAEAEARVAAVEGETQSQRDTQRRSVTEAFTTSAEPPSLNKEGDNGKRRPKLEPAAAREKRILSFDDILTATLGSSTMQGRLEALGDKNIDTPEAAMVWWAEQAKRTLKSPLAVRSEVDATAWMLSRDPQRAAEVVRAQRAEAAANATAIGTVGSEITETAAAVDSDGEVGVAQDEDAVENPVEEVVREAEATLDPEEGAEDSDPKPAKVPRREDAQVRAARDEDAARQEQEEREAEEENQRRAAERREAIRKAQEEREAARQQARQVEPEEDADPELEARQAKAREAAARVKGTPAGVTPDQMAEARASLKARLGLGKARRGKNPGGYNQPTQTRVLTRGEDIEVHHFNSADFIRRMFNPRLGVAGVQDRALLASLRKRLPSIEFVVMEDSDFDAHTPLEGAAGIFIPATEEEMAAGGPPGVIVFPRATMALPPNFRRDVFLHELVHAAQARSVVAGKGEHYGKIQALLRIAEQNFQGYRSEDLDYAFQNPAEFMAMAMTNTEVQQALAGVTLTDAQANSLSVPGVRTLFRAFVETVRRFLGLGQRSTNALEAAIWLGNDAMESSTRMSAMAREEARSQVAMAGALTDPVARILPANLFDTLPEVAQGRAAQAADTLGDKLTALRVQVQTLRQLEVGTADLWKTTARMQASNPAGKFNPIEQVSRAVLQRAKLAEDYVKSRFNNPLTKLAALPQDQQQEVSNFIVDTSMSEVDPFVDLTDDNNKHFNQAATPRSVQQRAQHAVLAQRYQSMVPEQKAAVQAVFASTRAAHADLIRGVKRDTLAKWWQQQVDASLGSSPKPLPMSFAQFEVMQDRFLKGAPTKADQTLLGQDYLDLLDEITKRAKLPGHYMPFQREGEFLVAWREPGDEVRRFDSLNEANRFSGTTELPVTGGRTVPLDANGKEITQPDPADLKRARDANVAVLPDNATPEQKAAAEKTAQREALKATRSRAAKTQHEVTVQTKGFAAFETLAEAQAFRQELESSGKQEITDVDLRETPEARNQFLDANVSKLLDKVASKGGMSQEAKAQLSGAFAEALVTLAPNQMLKSHLLQRRRVLGASRNVPSVLSNYATGTANYLANMETRLPLTEGLRAMRENIRGTNDGKTLERRRVLNEIERRVQESAFDPAGHGSVNPLMRKLQSLSFVYHLMSPSYAMIQMAQPYMFSGPVLSARYGIGKGSNALARAMNDIGVGAMLKGGGRETWRALKAMKGSTLKGEPESGSYLDMVKRQLGRDKANQGAIKMLDELEREGLVDSSAGLELVRTFKAREGYAATKLAQTESLARAMPAAVEVINRAGTAVAAYRLAMQKHGNHDAAVKEAREVVDMTQADYSNANSPRIMQGSYKGGLLAPLMQFRKFSQAVYNLIGRQIYLSVKGKDKAERMQAFRTFGYTMLAHQIVAGSLGLPTEPIGLVLGMMAWAMGADEPWDWETEVRKVLADTLGVTAGEAVAKGLPRLVGVDLSARLGLDSLLFMQDLRDFKATTFTGYAGQVAFGAPGAMVSKMASVPGLMMDGQFGKAAEAVLPKGFRDVAKAVRIANEGVTTQRGERIDGGEGPGISGAVQQALGFSPAFTAEVYDRRNAVQSANRQITTQRGDLMTRWKQATGTERSKVWQEIVAWNRGLTKQHGTVAAKAGITMQNLQSSLRESTRRAKVSGEQDFLPRNREFLRSEGRFADVD